MGNRGEAVLHGCSRLPRASHKLNSFQPLKRFTAIYVRWASSAGIVLCDGSR